MKLKLFVVLAAMLLLAIISCSGGGGETISNNNGGGGTNNNNNGVTPIEASASIGPSGGTIEVINSSSPLYNAKIQIPDGALDQQTTINIIFFSKTDLENQVTKIPSDMRFMGGIIVDASGAVLKKPVSVSLPNTFGANDNDQLLVGEVTNLYGEPSMTMIYRGLAHHIGSIDFEIFNIANITRCVILSPITPLVIVGGNFVNKSGVPISNGVITTSFSNPFIATTDINGYYVIPGGPAGSYPLILGIPPSDQLLVTPTYYNGIGVIGGFQLPNLTGVIPIPDLKIDNIDMPEQQEPCQCDPPGTVDIFSREELIPPFTLTIGQSTQTYMAGPAGVYGGNGSTALLDILVAVTGSFGISSGVSFSTDDSSTASVDKNTGYLTANALGQTWERGNLLVTEYNAKDNCWCDPVPVEAIPVQVIVKNLTPNEKWVMDIQNFKTTRDGRSCETSGSQNSCTCTVVPTVSKYFSASQLGWILVEHSGNNYNGYEVSQGLGGKTITGNEDQGNIEFFYTVDWINYYEKWSFKGVRNGNTIAGSVNLVATYTSLGPLCSSSVTAEGKLIGSGNFTVDIQPIQ